MSNKLVLFSVVRACNPVARITYTVFAPFCGDVKPCSIKARL